MKRKKPKKEASPQKQFENELSGVFLRWWEESDLDEQDMAQAAIAVIERFCDTAVEFECDFDLEDDE
jgi:hypothetical protein